MLVIDDRQWAALAAGARRGYPPIHAGHRARLGLPAAGARALADHVLALADARGLDDPEEIEALAQVPARAGPGREPAWCIEIATGAAPHRAMRLRACFARR